MSLGLPPRFWKVPLRLWPAFWVHYPPEMLWNLLRRLPSRLRWKLAAWLADYPGICTASVIGSEGLEEWPMQGISARHCLRNCPCWCGKYQRAEDLVRDLERLPDDPIRGARIRVREQQS